MTMTLFLKVFVGTALRTNPKAVGPKITVRRGNLTSFVIILLLALFSHPSHATESPALRMPTVGMPAKIEQLILPGTELEPKPLVDRQAKLVVRIVEVYPHGSSFRYNLSYYGLEPGEYDLKDYLQRKDGGSTANLPKIPVKVLAILPPGQIEPNRLEPRPAGFHVDYRFWAILAVVAWVAGFFVIVFAGRRRRKPIATEGPLGGPSLADRLRPLVEGAMAGTLGPGQHAELERMLIGYWRKRLDLDVRSPAEAMASIRENDEAGPLLRQLEAWLHSPDRAKSVDVAVLLEPYRRLPAEALEGGPAIAGRVG